jgi:hypothetical protein
VNAAEPIGFITLQESDLRIYRGTQLYMAPEGVALYEGDILETGARGLVQADLRDGTVVNLGAAAQAYVARYWLQGNQRTQPGELVLRRGWFKFATPQQGGAALQITTPHAIFRARNATGVLRVQDSRTEIMLEQGSVQGFGLRADGSGDPASATSIDNYAQRGAGGGFARAALAPMSFRSAVPVELRDTLPARVSKHRGATPQLLRSVSYGEADGWLKANPRLRVDFVTRFAPLLANETFRGQVVAHLAEHPEWQAALDAQQRDLGFPSTDPSPPALATPRP